MTFAAPFPKKWRNVRDTLIAADGGDVVRVARIDKSGPLRNSTWSADIEPHDTGDVTITVRGTTVTVPHTAEPVTVSTRSDIPGNIGGKSDTAVKIDNPPPVTTPPTTEPETANAGAEDNARITLSGTPTHLEEGDNEHYRIDIDSTELPTAHGSITVTLTGGDSLALSLFAPGHANYELRQEDSYTVGSGIEIAEHFFLRVQDDDDADDELITLTVAASSGTGLDPATVTIRVEDDDDGDPDFWIPPTGNQRATRDLPSIVPNYAVITDVDTGGAISWNTSLFTYTISGSDATDATRVRESLPRYFEVIYFADDTFGMEGYSKVLEGNCEREVWVFDPDEDADGDWTISLYVRVAVPRPDSRACSRPAGLVRVQPDHSEFGTKHFGGEVYDARSGRTDRGAVGGDTTTVFVARGEGVFGSL